MKRLLISILIIVSLSAPVVSPMLTPVVSIPVSAANPLNDACLGKASSNPICAQSKSQGTTNPISGDHGALGITTNLIALIGGLAAVIMVMAGGYGYVTSGGNSEKVAKARSRIVTGLIGLVIIGLAWVIVQFVLDKLL